MTTTKEKILWLCHWESPYREEWKGGMGKYMSRLAQELSQDFEFSIDIVTPNFADLPSKQRLFPKVNLFRLDIPSKSNIRNPRDMRRYAEGVLDFIKGQEKDYSLVHAHYWSSHFAGKAVNELGIPYILQLHQLEKPMNSAFNEAGLKYPVNKWRENQETKAVEDSDKTIFVSETQLREFVNETIGKHKSDQELVKMIEEFLNKIR